MTATPQEVLMLALINRARLDPAGEAARYGIDLNEGLAPGTISGQSKQPLAFSEALNNAADGHSQAMIDGNFFAHSNPYNGSTPQSRGDAAGYSGGVGENIAFSGSTEPIDPTQMISAQERDLFVDAGIPGRGHRTNLFYSGYQQAGVGQAVGPFTQNGVTYNTSMIDQDFGVPSSATQFITGIAYNDLNGDRFYSVGEARSGVTLSTATGTTSTNAAGDYARAIGAGQQTVTFSGGGLSSDVTITVAVNPQHNVLVNLVGPSTIETSTSLTAVTGVTKIIGLGNIGLTLTGSSADDYIVSALGNDTINGGAGNDSVELAGVRASYTVTDLGGGRYTVAGASGSDTINAVEHLVFSDQTIDLAVPSAMQPLTAFGDFDGNNHKDIFWRNANGAVSVWNDGSISGARIIADPHQVPSSWQIVNTGDFAGDGRSDILWRNDNGAVSVWDNGDIAGAHIIAGAGVVPTSWHVAGTGDFDGNGRSDILWRNDNGAVSIWDNGDIASAHIVAASGVVPTTWHIAAVTNFGADTKSDILWRNDNGAVSVWTDGKVEGASILAGAGAVPAGWHLAGTGDFDGNGRSDILWRNDDGAVSIWDNGEIGGAHIVAGPGVGGGAIPSSWHIEGTGDFDGNTRTDILWRNDSGAISVWDNGAPGQAHIVSDAGTVSADWHVQHYDLV